MNLHTHLEAEYGASLTIKEEGILFEKPLVLALKDLGYSIELVDYATKIRLKKDDKLVGEVPYQTVAEWHEKGLKDYYDAMYLDFTSFQLEK